MGENTTSDAQALATLGRFWADRGFDDPTGEFCILLDGRGPDEATAEREQVLALVERLGLETVEPRERGAGGEVWIRYDDRLKAEIDRWA
ncbi:MAG: hypothetical protein LBE25_14400 [Arthrobacter sp.]|jgi:hypothetical protein|nr:hypothetical protein [Arthrobacter sp.]